MKIRYTNAADPKLNNTETHLPNHIAQVLIATGAAVEIKYTHYSQRLAAEAATASGAGNVNPNAVGVEWGVKPSDGSQFSQNIVIKKVASNTIFYSGPPDDAPPSIKKRFAKLVAAAHNNPAEALAQAKREQAEQRERERIAPRRPWE